MKNYLKKEYPFIAIAILAFFSRFLFLNYPTEIVFDEVYFEKLTNSYLTNEYYFDIHPPLGKMIIVGTAYILGANPSENKDEVLFKIGESFNKKDLFSLRFASAFFGSLFIILIYKLVLAIGLSRKAAFLGSFLVLFDNSFLVQSKFILVDVFLLFFGFASIYFFVLAEKSSKKRILFYIISAVFAGLSFSVKWTGLSFWALIIILFLVKFLKDFKLKEFLKKIVIFIIVPFLVYFLVFTIHFMVVYKPASPEFQKTFFGSAENTRTLPLLNKFIENNKLMYKYNSGPVGTHPDASKWYEWPLMKKPIWYWVKNLDGKTANIYLLGNPLIWWAVSFAVLASLLIIFFNRFRKKLPPLIYFFIFGYFLNLLPFILVNRVTFLYHYLPSLIFGILILVVLYEKLLKNLPFPLYLGFLICVLILFLFLSPLSYGFPTSPQTYQMYKELFF